VDKALINTLLHQDESETLDFKEQQYPFVGATNDQKGELLKDILAFANAWKTSDAHLLIGVRERRGQKAEVLGVTEHLSDSNLQQFVNSKTDKPVRFLCGVVTIEGKGIDVIRVEQRQDRPICLTSNFGNLSRDTVYVRRGSSTDVAAPQEIAEMARADAGLAAGTPDVEIEFADPNRRRRLSTRVEINPVVFVDPPPPSSEQLKRATDELETGSTPAAGTFRLQVPAIRLPPMLRGPTKEDTRAYRQRIALLVGIGFWARNNSSVTAQDVRCEMHLPKREGLEVIDETGHPSNRHSIGLGISLPTRVLADAVVDEHPDEWIVNVDFGKLQPHTEIFLADRLYLASKESQALESSITVTGDNIPKPIEIPVEIHIEPEERVYREEDWEDAGQ